MKRIWKRALLGLLTLALVLCFVPQVTLAEPDDSGSCGANMTWAINLGTGQLTISGSGAMNNYYYSYAPWEQYKDRITKLVLSEGIGSIGDGAFCGYKQLTSLAIPGTVTSIGYYSFGGCTGLTSLTIPNSVVQVDDNAFSGCTGLTSLKLGAGLTTIGAYAFKDCTGLTSLTIPNSVTQINIGAFMNCTGVTALTMPCDVSLAIAPPDPSFAGCTAIKTVKLTKGSTGEMDIGATNAPWTITEANVSVTIDSGITLIGYHAFYNAAQMKSVTIPSTVTAIGVGAFDGCTGLTSISLPSGLTFLLQETFQGCTGLKSVIVPNKVATIGYAAFYGCSNLTTLTLPVSVTEIDNSAFGNCAKLKTVNYAGTQANRDNMLIRDNNGPLTSATWNYQTGAAKPTITTQPASVTVTAGAKATFKVVATGAESYKWQYQKPGSSSWTDVSSNGASATYTLTTATKHDGYKYRCKVTNAAGTVTSGTATLTVTAGKPTITTQPASVTVTAGAKATFKVVATGADSYKWQYMKPGATSWTNVSTNGASATYSLTAAAKHDGYKYRCAVKNAAGTVYSNTVTLTVKVLPTITTQPKAVTVYVGKKATFKVVASDADSYKWQYQKPGETSWTNVSSNGTSATYTLTTAVKHNGYTYRCAVKNGAGTVYTDAVKLTVSEKPVITTQPKAASVAAGAKATFKVVADGATSYKWQYQKPGSSTWTNVSKNGTSATYSLTTAAKHNGYKYRCQVKNDKGTVYTKAVTLTVN